jgi:hypothetical protein
MLSVKIAVLVLSVIFEYSTFIMADIVEKNGVWEPKTIWDDGIFAVRLYIDSPHSQ